MEVDHYDPSKKKDPIQNYANLLLASRHCNGNKGEFWPSPEQRRLGIRVINPCEEIDYGLHLFEDPISHKLVGATPTGIAHIELLDLNADHLVEERKQRTLTHVCYERAQNEAAFRGEQIPSDLEALFQAAFSRFIPKIPSPPTRNGS